MQKMNPYKIDIGAVYSHRVRLHACTAAFTFIHKYSKVNVSAVFSLTAQSTQHGKVGNLSGPGEGAGV